MPTARQTAAQKRAAATIAALPVNDDDDGIDYSDEAEGMPEPGLERVERQVTERTSLLRPTAPPMVHVDEPSTVDPWEQLLQEIGPASGTFIFVYREPDPPNATYRKPYLGRKQEYVTRIAFDERHNTSEAIYELIQRLHGGGEYTFVARMPSGQIRGRWQAAVSDLADPRLDQPAPPSAAPQIVYAQPLEPHPPAGPVTPPPSPMDMMKEMFGMFGMFQKMVPQPPPAPPPRNPLDDVVAQASAWKTLREVVGGDTPAAAPTSGFAEVVRELGVSEFLPKLGEAIVPIGAAIAARMMAPKAPPANGAAATQNAAAPMPAGGQSSPLAGAPAVAAEGASGGPAAISIPIPSNWVEAQMRFIVQILNDGRTGVHPGIAAQMCESYAQRFPEFRDQSRVFFGVDAPESNAEISRMIISAMSEMTPRFGPKMDLMQFPPFFGYMQDLREAVLDILAYETDGEAEAELAADPDAPTAAYVPEQIAEAAPVE